MNAEDNQRIVSYLLGELGEEERSRFEEQYFKDDALFDELELQKRDLIYHYLHDQLTETEKVRFERCIAGNPHLWEQVKFVRALDESLDSLRRPSVERARPSSPYHARFIAVGLTAVVLFSVIIWMYRENRNLRRQLVLNRAEAATVTSTSQPLPADFVEHLQLDASDLKIQAGREGATSNTQVFLVHKGIAVVETLLAFPQPTARGPYTAVLVDADGVERASVGQLSPRITSGTARVTALFPAAYLPQGSYVIRLKSTRADTVASLAFSIRTE